MLRDYRINNKRSVDEVARRIEKHFAPFFGGRRRSATYARTSDFVTFASARFVNLEALPGFEPGMEVLQPGTTARKGTRAPDHRA